MKSDQRNSRSFDLTRLEVPARPEFGDQIIASAEQLEQYPRPQADAPNQAFASRYRQWRSSWMNNRINAKPAFVGCLLSLGLLAGMLSQSVFLTSSYLSPNVTQVERQQYELQLANLEMQELWFLQDDIQSF